MQIQSEIFSPIDYALLARARQFYENKGFQYIEVPWLVEPAVSAQTKPHRDESFTLRAGSFSDSPLELVGSAEQGFMQLMKNLQLKPGHYQSISPCFRLESDYTRTHLPWFIKLELFSNFQSSGADNLYPTHEALVNVAKEFFTSLLLQRELESQLEIKDEHLAALKAEINSQLRVVEVGQEMQDIYLQQLEVGSYGKRHCQWGEFLYGTGLALPRWSLAHHESLTRG